VAPERNATGALALMLAGLAMLGPFTIDTYLPSFPAIAADLAVTPVQMQQTLSVYLIAFAVMTLFHGTLSDSLGRRPVILVSLAVFVLASIGCTLAGSFGQLLFFRALQGLSAGAGIVVGRAIIRDTFEGHAAQRLMSLVTMIFSLAPAIAPIIGGWLQAGFGWRSVFLFLVAYSALMLFVCSRSLPETLPPQQRQPFALAPLARNYWKLGRSLTLFLLSSAIALNFVGFFIYVVSAPAFVYNLLGLSETQFAWLFVPGITGVLLGAYLSGRLAGKVTPMRTIKIAYLVMFGAAAFNVTYSALFAPGLPWSVAPIMIYTIGMALAMPSLTLLALDLFPHNRGLAASLQGFEHSLLSGLAAGVLAPLIYHSDLTLALGMTSLLAAGWLCWIVYLARSARESPREAARPRMTPAAPRSGKAHER
jgi:MFS transporter, DHA1 family, multidrug resistance protein